MKKIIIAAAVCAAALFGGFAICTYAAGVKNDSTKDSIPQKSISEKEDSEEGITDKASELMFRNDISIEEIHGLKAASRAEIYQRLGEPHGSVSGGSFQQFHYILENGDIVIFSSGADDIYQRISIYNKNGELKNIISNEEGHIL